MLTMFPLCLIGNAKCEAIILDLDDDGNAELLIFNVPHVLTAAAFKATADERWILLGTVTNSNCAGVREALRDGKFQLAQPQFKELAVNQQRLRIQPGCQ